MKDKDTSFYKGEPDLYNSQDMIALLWDFEYNMISVGELTDYAELGFKKSLESLDEDRLIRRFNAMKELIDTDARVHEEERRREAYIKSEGYSNEM